MKQRSGFVSNSSSSSFIAWTDKKEIPNDVLMFLMEEYVKLGIYQVHNYVPTLKKHKHVFVSKIFNSLGPIEWVKIGYYKDFKGLSKTGAKWIKEHMHEEDFIAHDAYGLGHINDIEMISDDSGYEFMFAIPALKKEEKQED